MSCYIALYYMTEYIPNLTVDTLPERGTASPVADCEASQSRSRNVKQHILNAIQFASLCKCSRMSVPDGQTCTAESYGELLQIIGRSRNVDSIPSPKAAKPHSTKPVLKPLTPCAPAWLSTGTSESRLRSSLGLRRPGQGRGGLCRLW